MKLGNFVFTHASYSAGHIYQHEVGLVFWGLNTHLVGHLRCLGTHDNSIWRGKQQPAKQPGPFGSNRNVWAL